MSTWVKVTEGLPPTDDTPVLAVKEHKNGQREICIARCIAKHESHNYATGETETGPYWVCGGNRNIIYWMPLPGIPNE